MMKAIADTLAQSLNFTMDIINYDNVYGRQLANGSWNGVIGAVSRGEVDMCINDVSITHSRAKVVDFGFGVFQQSGGLFLRKPDQSVRQVHCLICVL